MMRACRNAVAKRQKRSKSCSQDQRSTIKETKNMGIKVREIIIPFFVDDKGVSRRKTPCVLMYVEFVKKKPLYQY